MAMTQMKHRNINNPHFLGLRDVISSCFCSQINEADLISDIQNASLDDSNNVYVYPDTAEINLDTIKLDDITRYRKELLDFSGQCDPMLAVDAICVDREGEWYFIEFKNSDICNKTTLRSIRKKMVNSLWFVFFLYSKAGKDMNLIFSGDITKYARENINYIIVGSQEKNNLYASIVQASESSGTHYTPPGLKQFVGYYFKNVYMLTELELRKFILDFAV